MNAHELGRLLLAGPDYPVITSGEGFEAEEIEVGKVLIFTPEHQWWYLFDRYSDVGVVELRAE